MVPAATATGISVMGDMPWGTHFCYFYETAQDLLETSVSFFQAGLENREFCLWVLHPPITQAEAIAALRESIPGLDGYLAEGALEIRVFQGGRLDAETLVARSMAFIDEKLENALASGFTGMRAAGSLGHLQKASTNHFHDFESRLGQWTSGRRVIALCYFPLAGCNGAEILDAARTHEIVLARRRGDCEVIEAPETKLTKVQIAKLNEQLEQRVEERTRALEAANEELRRQKEILQSIFDHIPVMINFVDQDNRIQLINQEWERTLGWSLEEIHRRNIDILEVNYPDPEYRQEVFNFVTTTNAEWRDFKTTVRDGRVIDTSWAMLHLSDGTGIGIGQDITKRKRAEEALRESEERFRELAENISEVFWLRSLDFKTLFYVSPMYERVCGKSLESLYAQGIDLSAIHPDDRARIRDIVENLDGREFEMEYRILAKDGRVRWIRDRGFPIRNHSGEVYRIGGVAEDVTDRKEAEDRLRASSEQLRALSASLQSAREKEATRIARQIHDDLGGILTSLRWELEALDKMLQEPTAGEAVKSMRERLATMFGLTETTIDVVRRIASELRPSILDDLGLMEAVEWQTQQFEARTGIQCRCDCALQSLRLPDHQSTAVFRIFQEALTNILRHALATRVGVTMSVDDGMFVLTVSDNGKGITPAEKLSRKSLGLLGMQERASLIGGLFEISGTRGAGTTLRVSVPMEGGASYAKNPDRRRP